MKKHIFALFLVCASCMGDNIKVVDNPTPTPPPTPTPVALEISQPPRRQWLIVGSTDTSQQPFQSPATTYFISTNHPTFKQLPDGSYMITFEP